MLNDAFFLGVLLFVSVVFLVVGFWRRQYFLTLASGVGLMLFGLFLLSGISYPVIASTTSVANASVVNLTTTTLNYAYKNVVWPVPYNPWTSMFFILSGLLLIFVAVFDFFQPDPVGGDSEE